MIVGLALNASPVCTEAYATPDVLGPVNHKLVTVDLLGVFDPDGDSFTMVIDRVFMDEAVNGEDDGDTAPDAFIVDGDTVELRAERSGVGNGRVYYVDFTVVDSYSNTCSGTVEVSVREDAPEESAASGQDDVSSHGISKKTW